MNIYTILLLQVQLQSKYYIVCINLRCTQAHLSWHRQEALLSNHAQYSLKTASCAAAPSPLVGAGVTGAVGTGVGRAVGCDASTREENSVCVRNDSLARRVFFGTSSYLQELSEVLSEHLSVAP